MRWRPPATAPPTSPGAPGVDALSFGFVKNGGLNAEALILFDRARRRSRGPPQARRASAVQGPHARRANPGDARRRPVARQCARRQRGGADARQGRAAIGWSIPVEANELFLRVTADEAAALRAQGFDFYDWGPGEIRLVTSWDQDRRSGRAARRRDRRAVSDAAAVRRFDASVTSRSSSSPRSGARPGSSSATSSASCRRNGRSPTASSSPPWRWPLVARCEGREPAGSAAAACSPRCSSASPSSASISTRSIWPSGTSRRASSRRCSRCC